MQSTDWIVRDEFIKERGAALFDHLIVYQTGDLLINRDLNPGVVPSFNERRGDVLLLVSNCGPTPSRREELLEWIARGFSDNRVQVDVRVVFEKKVCLIEIFV